MTSSTPSTTVLMSVYNCEQYVDEAIESVLAQTYGDFEFIIVDDGSTDGTSDILHGYEIQDSRVHVVRTTNRGMAAGLATGLGLAQGEIIARQDADDISMPTRFEEQVGFLLANPDYAVVGCAGYRINSDGVICAPINPPTTDIQVRRILFAGGNPMVHPSLVMRRAAVVEVGGYRSFFREADDYDLLLRLAEKGHRITNLPNRFSMYRKSTDCMNWTRALVGHEYHNWAYQMHLDRLRTGQDALDRGEVPEVRTTFPRSQIWRYALRGRLSFSAAEHRYRGHVLRSMLNYLAALLIFPETAAKRILVSLYKRL